MSIARTISMAGMSMDKYVRQSEVHGVAQRGASVVSYIRISDSQIYSDLIPLGHADMIVSMEPMETLRYVSYMKHDCRVFVSAKSIKTAFNYPDKDKLKDQLAGIPNCQVIDLETRAREIGSLQTVNIIMMGIISPFLPFPDDVMEPAIKSAFSDKGKKILEISLEAYRMGKKLSDENHTEKS